MKNIVMSVVAVFTLQVMSNERVPLLSSGASTYYQTASVYPAVSVDHNYTVQSFPQLFQTVARGDFSTFKALLAQHLDSKNSEVFTTLYGDNNYKIPFLLWFTRYIVTNMWQYRFVKDSLWTEVADNSLERFYWHAFSIINFDYTVKDSLGRTVLHVLAEDLFSGQCYENQFEKVLAKILSKIPQDKQRDIVNMQDASGKTVLHTLVNCALNNHKKGVYCRAAALKYFKKLVDMGAVSSTTNMQQQSLSEIITKNLNQIDQAERFVAARNTVLCWIFCPLAICCGNNTLLYHSDATLLQEMLRVISKK